MIKVCFQQFIPDDPDPRILEVPAVPRVNDYLTMDVDREAGLVVSVIWTPGNPEYDVQVRYR